MGLPAITGLGVFESFFIPFNRLFFQPGALFRLFSGNATGRFRHLAETAQTEYHILFFRGMCTFNHHGSSSRDEPVGMDSLH